MSDKILEWYGGLRTRRVDLVGDYAGPEIFLIEGDSLLLQCFSDPKLDLVQGFQLLHAIYSVEAFLHGLKQRKCNFHIVFFDNHAHYGRPRSISKARLPRYLLARAVLIRHLQSNLVKVCPSIQVYSVPSMQSEDFQTYLAEAQPYFVMAHDGADLISLSEVGRDPNCDAVGPTKENSESENSVIQRIALRLSIYKFLTRGYSVALINGTDWVDTKVMSQVIERSSSLAIERRDSASSSPGNQSPESEQVDGNSLPDTSILQSSKPANDLSPTAADSAKSESRSIVLQCLDRILQEDPSKRKLVCSFLIHFVLLQHLRLSDRRFQDIPAKAAGNNEVQNFLDTFANLAMPLVSKGIRPRPSYKNSTSASNLSDLVDGRLFATVMTNFDAAYDVAMAKFSETAHSILKGFEAISGKSDLLKRLAPVAKASKSRTAKAVEKPSVLTSILPFSNAVFDNHLASIHIKVGSDQVPYPRTARIFQEVSHWHNHKRLLDPKSVKEVDEKAKKRALRRNQFFMAEMQAYAASLTNAAGKLLDPEIITATTVAEISRAAPKKEVRPQAQPKAPSKQKPGKSTGKAAVMENVAAKKAQMADDSTKKAIQAWQTLRKGFDSESSLPFRYRKAANYLKTLDTAPELLRIEVQLYLIQILLEILKASRKQSKTKEGSGLDRASNHGVYALLWTTARNLATTPLNQTVIDKVAACLKTLKLPNVVFAPSTDPQKLSFEPSLSISTDFAVQMGAKEFQMCLCGPYMDRNLDSAPDPRVPFEPDAWQRKVLDQIDADRSVFVVAPTSAGKTFISFRAMERVLRSSNDGILVYVAPTKALVNQIAAEIQARFKKSYKYAGISVWAIHTRDYRINNPNGCQVLVTVPAIFQIMLLSPTNANSWCNRLRFAIFDEVHCIGQAEDGIVWEQNILLCPCPVIALSATVGNPEQFYDWLSSTQKSYGHQSTMVVHQHRYSDLRKFMYTAPDDFAFNGLTTEPSFGTLGLDDLAGLTHIHPVASLGHDARGMPRDLSLEARDCYILWEIMSKHQTDDFPVPSSLDPESGVLPAIIRKKDVIGWEASLKDLLRTWMENAQRSPFHRVVQELQVRNSSRLSQTSKGTDSTPSEATDGKNLLKTTLPLLYQLHERNALPAILFNYDRSKCVAIGIAVLDQLEEAEEKWKSTSQTWQNKVQKWELYKKNQEKAASKKPAKSSKKKGKGDDEEGSTKADMVQDMANLDLDPMANFDPDAPLEPFSFAVHSKVDSAELKEYFRQLKWKGIAQGLMDALRRGIGIHHAGMNRKYRQIVEMLFRKGFLRVVIATGTLALGINMPCATVVFSGDSIFLTALNYRQAAGRAGRRGFDLLGNVVFQGIPEDKVFRLMSSRLPDLNGHFPITTTLVLRLFTLLTESKNATYAVNAINSLLSQPRLYLDSPIFKEQVLHHLRFSIEYLRRQDLLSSQGTPINFAGLTSHLYYTENASFAFNALVKSGYLHELCSGVHHSQSKVLRTLMLVMAHLFGRHKCRDADAEYIERFVKRSPSIVFLPPMPEGASKAIKKHNRETLATFRTYVETFVEQHVNHPDDTLPLSKLQVGGSDTLSLEESASIGALPPVKIRSPFVALSGHGDTFSQISDLCATVRSGVFLEKEVVPHIDLYPEESASPLNAYLYDFYMHGDITALEAANGVRKSDVWFVLNDFSMILATIVTSLANLLKLPNSDVNMMDVVGGGDAQMASADDLLATSEAGFSDTDTTTTTTTGETSNSVLSSVGTGITTPDSNDVSSMRPSSPKKKAAKKAVAESWDDEEDGNSEGGDDGDEEGENWDDDDDDDDDDSEDGEDGQEGKQRSTKEIEKGFKDIYLAFSKLKREFDEKFHKIFA